MTKEHPKCISRSGRCPVVGCDKDGVCYLAECEGKAARRGADDRATVILAVLGVLLAFGIAGNGDYAEDKARELRAGHRYANWIANCMNGGAIFWQDPHTQQNVGAFCDVHIIPISPPAVSPKADTKGGKRT